MRAPGDRESAAELASETGQNWLGNSVWQVPDLEIAKNLLVALHHRDELPLGWRPNPLAR